MIYILKYIHAGKRLLIFGILFNVSCSSLTFASDENIYKGTDSNSQKVSADASEFSPSQSTINEKALLDENIRYITVPGKEAEFGLVKEKRVRLKLDSNVTYDTNIFLTKDDTKDDIITHITPGIYAYSGNEKNMYLAYYDADIFIHSKNKQESRINQVIGGRADLFRTGMMKLTIKDTFKPTTDAATSESEPFVRRMYNDFETKLRYDMSPKTSTALSYKQYLQYYITSGYKSFNYMQHIISPIMYWHVTPKTSVTGEYNLGITHYTGSANYNSVFNQARVGIEGHLTPKSTIYLRTGYQYRIYDESGRKNTQAFVLEGVYDYALSPKTTFEFVAARNIDESIYADVGYFKAINLYVSMMHHIRYNLDLNVTGIYIRNDYPHDTPVTGEGDIKRSDNLYRAGAKLIYRFRSWIFSYVECVYQTRNSNIRDFGYLDNTITGGINISF